MIKNSIQNVDPKNTSQKKCYNYKHSKENVTKYAWDGINASSIHSSKFHVQLKKAAIESVHKKLKFSKETYRPISFLSNIFKV